MANRLRRRMNRAGRGCWSSRIEWTCGKGVRPLVAPVSQGAFKSFPVQSNAYCFTLLRYVESNPLRAGLVRRSADWEWSSLAIREGAAKDGLVLAGGPVAVPERWARLVDVRPGEDDLRRLEDCMRRGCPFGSDAWTMAVAERLDLMSTVRPRGRPRAAEGKGS
jgi:putative transposase